MAFRTALRAWYLEHIPLYRVQIVELTAQDLEGTGIAPGRVVKVVAIAAPSIRTALFGFMFNSVIIGLFLGAAVYRLSPGDYAAAVGPTLLFGLNSTLRLVWKIRERVAIQARWPVLVARQRPVIRVAAACIGLLIGTVAMFWFLKSLSVPFDNTTIAMAAMVAGVIELVRNTVRIGGNAEIPNFDIRKYTRYFPYTD